MSYTKPITYYLLLITYHLLLITYYLLGSSILSIVPLHPAGEPGSWHQPYPQPQLWLPHAAMPGGHAPHCIHLNFQWIVPQQQMNGRRHHRSPGSLNWAEDSAVCPAHPGRPFAGCGDKDRYGCAFSVPPRYLPCRSPSRSGDSIGFRSAFRCFTFHQLAHGCGQTAGCSAYSPATTTP